jgi:hypothetical protein
MSAEKAKEGNQKPEETENLSATAMFLRGFESSSRASSGPGNAAGTSHATPPSQAPVEPRVEPRVPATSAPGEFTSLFQTASSPGSSSPTATEAVKLAPSTPAGSARAASGPGEFTRIFVSGQTPPASAPAQQTDAAAHSVAAAPPVGDRSKGFSSPGLSDSASGEGGFTQFFESALGQPPAPAKPSASSTPSAPSLAPPHIAPQPIPPGRQEFSGSRVNSPSVTSLLSSLSSAAGSSAAPTRLEPEPFRAAPVASWNSPTARSAEPPAETGGVTQLIQKLGHEPATVTPEPISPAPAAAPVDSGPGEFTRMISILGASGASPSAPAASTPPAAQPAAAPQVPSAPPVQVPVKVAVQVPPLQVPTPPASAAPAAAPKVPPIAVPVPPVPKLAPAIPAAAVKGKFDAIVPVLLIVNTFLLLAILLVLLFQARGH